MSRIGNRIGRVARLMMMIGWLGASIVGCTYANKRLNAENVEPEARVKNQTRASLGSARVTRSISVTQPAIEPSTKRADVSSDTEADGYFVGVAISGGGSRSAVFSAACMFELQRLGILQHVDYISAVSGGSLTGAYYCSATDRQWNPGNVQRRLTHPFATDIVMDMLQPWNTIALMFTDWDRSDLLAAAFQRTLFSRNGHALTYADLRADRPRLLLNSTDLQSGKPFIFCNESFDEINSDLKKYPLAYAVAASAAVPVVMHQVTLRDFSTVFKQYRHLIDGGVTDNLGITTLVETYDSQLQSAERAHRPTPYPHGAIFIILDARTDFDVQLSNKGDTGLLESLQYGAGLTSTALLNRASSATMSDMIVKYSPDDVTAQQLRAQIKKLTDEGMIDLQDRAHNPVQVVHLALTRVNELHNLPFPSFSERINSIATYFNIDPTEAYQLNKAAELLVHEQFQQRLEEIANDLKKAGGE